jgi:hypothetical protein
MSDWVTHLGWAYLPARWLGRDTVRLALLGAVLPDAATPIVVLVNLLHLHPGAIEAYLQPLQAPVPTLALAFALALLTADVRRSLVAIALGMLVHYALDITQMRYGGGIYLLYPASFWSPSLDLYWPESAANLALLAAGTAGTAWALLRPGGRIRWRRGRAGRAALVASAGLLLPAFTLQGFVAANLNNVDFFARPAAYEGRELRFAKLEVVAVAAADGAARITVRKGDHRLAVRTEGFEWWGRVSETPPAVGKRISFAGTYRHGVLETRGPVHVHFRPLRTWTSLAALVILALLVWPERRRAGQRPERDR